ncbi:MAG: regulatory protein RecX [Saprospiraceae bacterium]
MKKKYISQEEALDKLEHYCAYQDRCHQEVRQKLYDLGVYGDVANEIIAELITENFLNEERFARSYARGKFRMKKWGKFRITLELKRRNISPYCIKKAMEELEEFDYDDTLFKLLEKKHALIRESDAFKKRGKLAKYAIGKGYESGLVWEMVKEHF